MHAVGIMFAAAFLQLLTQPLLPLVLVLLQVVAQVIVDAMVLMLLHVTADTMVHMLLHCCMLLVCLMPMLLQYC